MLSRNDIYAWRCSEQAQHARPCFFPPRPFYFLLMNHFLRCRIQVHLVCLHESLSNGTYQKFKYAFSHAFTLPSYVSYLVTYNLHNLVLSLLSGKIQDQAITTETNNSLCTSLCKMTITSTLTLAVLITHCGQWVTYTFRLLFTIQHLYEASLVVHSNHLFFHTLNPCIHSPYTIS